jgi:hypothetical protein
MQSSKWWQHPTLVGTAVLWQKQRQLATPPHVQRAMRGATAQPSLKLSQVGARRLRLRLHHCKGD